MLPICFIIFVLSKIFAGHVRDKKKLLEIQYPILHIHFYIRYSIFIYLYSANKLRIFVSTKKKSLTAYKNNQFLHQKPISK